MFGTLPKQNLQLVHWLLTHQQGMGIQTYKLQWPLLQHLVMWNCMLAVAVCCPRNVAWPLHTYTTFLGMAIIFLWLSVHFATSSHMHTVLQHVVRVISQTIGSLDQPGLEVCLVQ